MGKIVKTFLTVLVIIGVLVSFHYLGWIKPVENIFVRIFAPVEGGLRSGSLGMKNFYGNWIAKKDLISENEQLKEQLKNYQMDLSRANSLSEENQLLKQELKFVKDTGYKYVSAKIITGVSDPLSQSVVINRGKSDGIVKGLAVIAGGGIMVGKVTEVQDNFSKVLLLTDSNSKVAATVQNDNRTAGLVEGQYGLSFSMTNIPQDQQINENDLIVTSGLEGQIPKNILIAKVGRIDKVESEIFKTAMLSPLVSFANLSDVLVIIP